jgi:hypothetical protein
MLQHFTLTQPDRRLGDKRRARSFAPRIENSNVVNAFATRE